MILKRSAYLYFSRRCPVIVQRHARTCVRVRCFCCGWFTALRGSAGKVGSPAKVGPLCHSIPGMQSNDGSIYRPSRRHNSMSYLFLWRESKTVSIANVCFRYFSLNSSYALQTPHSHKLSGYITVNVVHGAIRHS